MITGQQTKVESSVAFSDFIFLIWPSQKFRKVSEDRLMNVNDIAYLEESPSLCDGTLCLIAEILANYL